MTPLVKICGITNLEDALVCASAGADMLGFIFYSKSPRCIEPSKAAGIIKHLPASVTPVGVFVNEKSDVIKGIVHETHLGCVQLSGDETPADCEGMPVPVWKAFRLRAVDDVTNIRDYKIDAVMLDGANDTEYGGSGILPDMSVANEMKKYHRIIIAGGLHPGNIADLVRQVNPYAVDVNSGVELTPGKKDRSKVQQLFQRLKG
ncbi:MAG TPA: phosphoribosylanthranilate isomerase [Bacteroidota bacterium]|jgi:phosphoribosylanthranilate isomerase|nr:phosphoribosylanthranilate isomerase [Bacteroidota bacterium]